MKSQYAIALLMAFGLALRTSACAGKGSVAINTATDYTGVRIALSEPMPGEGAYTQGMMLARRGGNSERKARVGKGLVISGIACLAVGVPLAVVGVSRLNKIASDPYSTDMGIGPAFMTVGGIALSAVGIGLTIPGAIIYSKNK